ncbi:MAG: hypothetical protein LAO77_24165 [Acidobacteriia bacterium]|nr:hypothetical protein [Terriglobia bacterium]
MSLLGDLRKKIAAVAGSVSEQIQSARLAIEAARNERRQLLRAPLPLAEIDERIDGVVEREGAEWLQKHAAELLRTNRYLTRALAQWDGRGAIEVPGTGDADFFGLLCAGAPAFAAETLRALIRRVEFTAGAPSSDRPKLIAAIEARLAALEHEEEALVDELNAGGLMTFQHRPEVVQRRSDAARARELEEQRVADRRARQAAVDAQMEAPQPGYLARERPDKTQY